MHKNHEELQLWNRTFQSNTSQRTSLGAAGTILPSSCRRIATTTWAWNFRTSPTVVPCTTDRLVGKIVPEVLEKDNDKHTNLETQRFWRVDHTRFYCNRTPTEFVSSMAYSSDTTLSTTGTNLFTLFTLFTQHLWNNSDQMCVWLNVLRAENPPLLFDLPVFRFWSHSTLDPYDMILEFCVTGKLGNNLIPKEFQLFSKMCTNFSSLFRFGPP